MKAIGQILKELREEKKMSQREVAIQSGLTQSHISTIENSTTEPTLPTIFKICKALDIEPSVISNMMAKSFRSYLEMTYNVELNKSRELQTA
jgi:transcriptional regulator with XRE-family HTH domain